MPEINNLVDGDDNAAYPNTDVQYSEGNKAEEKDNEENVALTDEDHERTTTE